MKSILVFLMTLVFTAPVLLAQDEGGYPVPYDEEEEMIIYTDVEQVMGANHVVLYNRAMEWANDYYTNFDKKVDNKSKEEGIIQYDGEFRLDPDDYSSTTIKYSADIMFKDGRYKYKIYKLHIRKGYYYELERWLDPDEINPEVAKERLSIVDERIKKIIDSMTSYIANPPKKQKEDW